MTAPAQTTGTSNACGFTITPALGGSALFSQIPATISIHDQQDSTYSQIPWDRFVGQDVAVVYDRKLLDPELSSKHGRRVNQRVMALSHLEETDQHAASIARNLLDTSHSESAQSLLVNQLGYSEEAVRGSIFGFRETAIWSIRTSAGVYISDPFTSKRTTQIDPALVGQIFNDLVGRVQAEESGVESDLLEIAFFHTHPGTSTPLSVADRATMETFNEALGNLQDDQSMSIYAIPICAGGDLVFRHTIEGKDNNIRSRILSWFVNSLRLAFCRCAGLIRLFKT